MSTLPLARPYLTPSSCPADVNALIARWQVDGEADARDAVFERFSLLARKLARRYHTAYEPFEDLLQVAFVGLMAAIDRFDPSRGSSFATFAIPTILGELKRYFRDTGWAVHVPRGQQEMALTLEDAIRQIVTRSGRHPGVGELAEYLELSTEAVLAAFDAGGAHYAISLDAPLTPTDPEEPGRVGDTIGRDDDGYALMETTVSLAAAIGRLPYRERQALSLRLEQNMKQSEIAAALGCSQMQVSRLLRRAALRLREMASIPS
jgi:RNA polymerase sigma-B factor